MLDSQRVRLRSLSFLCALALAVALPRGAVRGDEAEDFRRLEALPSERRAKLVESLAEFDRLPESERAAIRRLDSNLARRDPIDRARLQTVLSRYHLWLNGLSEEQRRLIEEAASPAERMTQVQKIRQKVKSSEAEHPLLSGLRVGQLGMIGPHEVALVLKVWEKLPEEKRKTLGALRGNKLRAGIRAEAGRLKVAMPPLPAEVERVYEARLEADPDLKFLAPPARKPDPAGKPPEKAVRRVDHPYAEFLYYEDPDHRPKPVAVENLARFLASCPPWFLAMTDPLSPDDARAYTTVVYRLLYPAPGEMPEKTPVQPGSDAPKVAPRPASKSQAGTAVPL